MTTHESRGGLPARLTMPPAARASGLSPDQWRVLAEAIFPAAKSADAIMLAVDYCRARKLDPFKRPVHIVPMYSTVLRKQVETVWPGINELQVTAARTGQWAGMDPPKWGPDAEEAFTATGDGEDGRRVTKTVKVTFPEWCEVTVYRLVAGHRCAFSETVYWLESYARTNRWSDAPNEMWRKRPRGQLQKCAKAAALRAAFPEDCSDYTAEEMEGKPIDAGGITIDGKAESVQQHSAGHATPSDVEPQRPAPKGREWAAAYDAASGFKRPDPDPELIDLDIDEPDADPAPTWADPETGEVLPDPLRIRHLGRKGYKVLEHAVGSAGGKARAAELIWCYKDHFIALGGERAEAAIGKLEAEVAAWPADPPPADEPAVADASGGDPAKAAEMLAALRAG